MIKKMDYLLNFYLSITSPCQWHQQLCQQIYSCFPITILEKSRLHGNRRALILGQGSIHTIAFYRFCGCFGADPATNDIFAGKNSTT